MNPADQPPFSPAQRAAESPTLWLSLALGSVLIHLVLFILASLVLNRTAKVQLDIEPIAVEFVDPNAVRSTAAGRAIAVRPGKPSSTRSSSLQAQPNVQQSTSPKQPVEQALLPLQPAKPKRLSMRPQQVYPNLTKKPIAPQQTSTSTSQSQLQSNSKDSPGRTLSTPSGNSTEQDSPGGTSSTPSGNSAESTSGSQEPATSETKLTEPPEGGDVVIDLKISQPYNDSLTKAANIPSPITASIQYPPRIAQALRQGIDVTVSLDIDQSGFVKEIFYTKLSSTASAIDQATLNDLANQIFKERQFEPAQADPGGLTVKPRRSNPIIKARIRLL